MQRNERNLNFISPVLRFKGICEKHPIISRHLRTHRALFWNPPAAELYSGNEKCRQLKFLWCVTNSVSEDRGVRDQFVCILSTNIVIECQPDIYSTAPISGISLRGEVFRHCNPQGLCNLFFFYTPILKHVNPDKDMDILPKTSNDIRIT